jgi:hypothetical protein
MAEATDSLHQSSAQAWPWPPRPCLAARDVGSPSASPITSCVQLQVPTLDDARPASQPDAPPDEKSPAPKCGASWR